MADQGVSYGSILRSFECWMMGMEWGWDLRDGAFDLNPLSEVGF